MLTDHEGVLIYKGSIQTFDLLPMDCIDGDMYFVSDDSYFYVRDRKTNTGWKSLPSAELMKSFYYTKDEVDALHALIENEVIKLLDPVDTKDNLPVGEIGDLREALDTGVFYLYTPTGWNPTGGLTNLVDYYKKSETDALLSEKVDINKISSQLLGNTIPIRDNDGNIIVPDNIDLLTDNAISAKQANNTFIHKDELPSNAIGIYEVTGDMDANSANGTPICRLELDNLLFLIVKNNTYGSMRVQSLNGDPILINTASIQYYGADAHQIKNQKVSISGTTYYEFDNDIGYGGKTTGSLEIQNVDNGKMYLVKCAGASTTNLTNTADRYSLAVLPLESAFVKWNEPIGKNDLPSDIVYYENIDAIPTQESANLVTSGGVYDSISSTQGDINNIYQELSDIRSQDRRIVGVTHMFDFPSDAMFIAELHRSLDPGDPDMIVIRAQDTTGVEQDLVITAAIGFGSLYATNKGGFTPIKKEDGSISMQPYMIEVTQETNLAPCQIKVPKECNSIDSLFYYVGQSEVSYWVDTSGNYHPFSIADTSWSAFASASSTWIINGERVNRNNIVYISFSSEYDGSQWSEYTFFYARSIYGLKLPATTGTLYGLSNIDNGYTYLSNIEKLDLRKHSGFISGLLLSKLTQLHFSNTNKLSGGTWRYRISTLQPITLYCNDLNISLSGIDTSSFYNNDPSSCVRWHDTQELADSFLAYFPNVAEWQVNIGIPPNQ